MPKSAPDARWPRNSGVADASGAWVGGTTHLVQTGDLVDRGDDSVAVLRLFWRLRDEAQEAGGNVTLLLGNHEVRRRARACVGAVFDAVFVRFGRFLATMSTRRRRS